MATNLRKELFENRNLKIDFIAGPDSYKRLPQLIEEALVDTGHTSHVTRRKIFDVTLSEFETYSDVFPRQGRGDRPVARTNAWVAVMRGCNNFCTFCVVPYTRGRERSRSIVNIVDEIKHIRDDGFKQVTLLGQNVNSYKSEGSDFANLLEAVSKVQGIERIRFTSPHPKDFPQKLLEVIAHNKKVCKNIHLPLQAGSNRILDLMNRTYTREEFLSLVDKIRALIPGITLSTDIIVGFCTETDKDFEETLDVMQKVKFDSAFMFKYSQRKNTIAERKYKDDVPESVKTERIVKLNELQKEIAYKQNKKEIGRVFDVLIEQEHSKKHADTFIGRTDGNKIVSFPAGDYLAGDFVKATITRATPHALEGEPVS